MPEEFNPEEEQQETEVLPKRKKKVSKFLEENVEEKKQQYNLYFIVALIMSILLILTGVFATYKYFQDDFQISLFSSDKQGKNKSDKNNLKVKGGLFNRKHNILILGVDSNGTDADPFENTRSDTILIVTLKPKEKSANIISIPRDSKVFIAHRNGVQKINAAHALGGVKLTKDTIEETFGIKINNYIVFNTDGIVKFIDAIGGVPVYIEKDMSYHDWSGKLHIDLKKGTHMLSGKEAEGYLRYRKDALGDIGRTSRQQWFVRAVAERLKDPEVITKIPEALRIADEYVKSDLSLYQMAQYAAYAANIDLSKVETATMPGAPNKKGYISYWILDPDQCKDVISRMVYNKKPSVDADKLPVAGIMYTPNNEQQAMTIKNKLEEAGYTVNCSKMSRLPHNQVFGHTNIVTSQFMNKLKNTCPEIKDMQFVYDPTKIYCANSDFTIIISK